MFFINLIHFTNLYNNLNNKHNCHSKMKIWLTHRQFFHPTQHRKICYLLAYCDYAYGDEYIHILYTVIVRLMYWFTWIEASTIVPWHGYINYATLFVTPKRKCWRPYKVYTYKWSALRVESVSLYKRELALQFLR